MPDIVMHVNYMHRENHHLSFIGATDDDREAKRSVEKL